MKRRLVRGTLRRRRSEGALVRRAGGRPRYGAGRPFPRVSTTWPRAAPARSSTNGLVNTSVLRAETSSASPGAIVAPGSRLWSVSTAQVHSRSTSAGRVTSSASWKALKTIRKLSSTTRSPR